MNSARLVLRLITSATATLLMAALITSSANPVMAEEHRPRVFITNSESWEVVSSAGGSGGTFASHTQGGARPQTAEIIKTFGERCQQVIVNNKQEKADYVVVLDHEGGKGYLLRRNKVAVFNKEGDAIVSRSTRSLGNSVQDACAAIVADWSNHGSALPTPASGSALQSDPLPKPAPGTQSLSLVPAAQRQPEIPIQPTPVRAVAAEKTA